MTAAPAPSADWLLWQLADSAFPSGGFAHSGGAEAAYQWGELRRRDDLLEFLEAAITQLARSWLPFVASAFNQEKPFAEIDHVCDAFTSNHVANRASRLQGQAFLASCERAFANHEISALRKEIINNALPGHFAPVFGAIARILRLESTAALRLGVFIQLRGWMSSAVRLGIIGPIEAQSIQVRMTPIAERTVEACKNFTIDDVAQTAPLIDLFQGTQDRLYSRLFQS